MARLVMLKRLSKYIASSFLAVGIDFGLLFSFVEFLGWNYLWAATVSFTLGHSVNYLISRHWNFKNTDRRHKVAYVLFVGFGLFSLGLTLYLLRAFVDDAGFNYINARILTGCIIGTLNFIFNYYITFKAHLIPDDVDKFHLKKARKN
jgi:putative flippase GtrA